MSAGAQESILDHQLDTSESHMVGITMSDSVEGRVIADLMEGREGVWVTRYPAMLRIDAQDKLIFNFDEISEALGKDMDPYTFQIEMSTHYGRMDIQDDSTLVLYGHVDEHLAALDGEE